MVDIGETFANECHIVNIVRIHSKCITSSQISWLAHADPAQSFAESAFGRTCLYPADTAIDTTQWWKNKSIITAPKAHSLCMTKPIRWFGSWSSRWFANRIH